MKTHIPVGKMISILARLGIGIDLIAIGFNLPHHFAWYNIWGYYLGTGCMLLGSTLALSIF